MINVFIVRRDAARIHDVQARLKSSRIVRVLGSAQSLYRARPALERSGADALLIDLRLEDGAALPLVRDLRQRRGERRHVMVLATRAADPLLFATLTAGAEAYLMEADLTRVEGALTRLVAGEATMAPEIAAQALHYYGDNPALPEVRPPADDRQLDWQTNATNPMLLSPGERRLLRLIMGGMGSAEVAARTATSVEAVGRRIAHVYRKLAWDVNSGALSPLAA
jgi:DNA-binding NarL/FixJ family response regulator